MRTSMPVILASVLSLAGLIGVVMAHQDGGAETLQRAGSVTPSKGPAGPSPRPAATSPHIQRKPLSVSEQPPVSSPKKPPKQTKSRAAAACSPGDIIDKTGAALVTAIKVADPEDCLYPLFSLSGGDANKAFRESQMITVANAYRSNAAAYPGNNSTSTLQLVLYLRAGYFVQAGRPNDVGPYGPALKAVSQAAMDTFFGNSRAWTVNEENGEVLYESLTLITNAKESPRYLSAARRVVESYATSWGYYMEKAVWGGLNVVFYGHWTDGFLLAVQRDPSVLTALYNFSKKHLNLLGTNKGYLVGGAGGELGRFVQYAPLQSRVRPWMRDLLTVSKITGPTATLWVAVGKMADEYDKANCSYYGTCDFKNRLIAAALPINHTCASTLKIKAQAATSTERTAACTSLLKQDTYFHNLVKDSGPVAGDNNTSLQVVAFQTKIDYSTYASAIYGIDTDNGGMYLEGDPSKPGNQARFIAYQEASTDFPGRIRNLNHEYTHYLDGRFTMHGDFTANISTPTVWWIEGFAEVVSYGYRGIKNTDAIAEARKRTYTLSTLFDTTYENGDSTRVYEWGYLAVRYMFEKHPREVATVLGHYRKGNWNAARTFLKSLSYNTDFNIWLSACATGACAAKKPAVN